MSNGLHTVAVLFGWEDNNRSGIATVQSGWPTHGLNGLSTVDEQHASVRRISPFNFFIPMNGSGVNGDDVGGYDARPPS